MFTGIITHRGVIKNIVKSGDWLFSIAVDNFTHGLALGASVALNGACMTVTARDKGGFSVQVSRESLARTTLGRWKKGTRINLERALKMGDELGGHLVSGHVDALAVLEKKKKAADSLELTFSAPKDLRKFIAKKGSVVLDGVSLTINEAKDKRFSVNIIPHTQKETTLGGLQVGEAVNLEIDLIARYLYRLKGKTA